MAQFKFNPLGLNNSELPDKDNFPREGLVNDVCKEWLMHEDQALAYRLQTEEYKHHLGHNRERNAILRKDTPKAREEQIKADEEAARAQTAIELSLAKQESRDAALAASLAKDYAVQEREKHKQQEEKDNHLAKKLMEEEKLKVRQSRELRQVEREAAYLGINSGLDNVAILSRNDKRQKRAKSSRDSSSETNRRKESLMSENLSDLSDFCLKPSSSMDEDEMRILQEEQDQELAILMQEQDLKRRGDLLQKDQLLAIEAQDKELAKILQEQEKAKAKKGREKARQKAMIKKQSQQEKPRPECPGAESLDPEQSRVSDASQNIREHPRVLDRSFEHSAEYDESENASGRARERTRHVSDKSHSSSSVHHDTRNVSHYGSRNIVSDDSQDTSENTIASDGSHYASIEPRSQPRSNRRTPSPPPFPRRPPSPQYATPIIRPHGGDSPMRPHSMIMSHPVEHYRQREIRTPEHYPSRLEQRTPDLYAPRPEPARDQHFPYRPLSSTHNSGNPRISQDSSRFTNRASSQFTNIACVIDPTYERRVKQGELSSPTSVVSSPSYHSSPSQANGGRHHHSSPDPENVSPSLKPPVFDDEDDYLPPPYMPIQGQRRTASLEKRKDKKDGCKQQ